MRKKFIFICLLFLFLSFSLHNVAKAEGFEDFDVNVILPENQINTDVTYFDLLAPPNFEQVLNVEISNRSEVTRTIECSINRAFTNSNGTISYSSKTVDEAPGLEYNIENLVSLSDSKIVIDPNQTKILSLTLKIPNKMYSGILVGGLYLLDATESDSEGNIKNQFAREIGIVLHGSKDSFSTSDKIELIGVKATQKDNKNAIILSFENKKPGFFSDFSLGGYIVDKNGSKNALSFRKDQISMAPNSILNYPVFLDSQPFVAGIYTFKGTITKDNDVISIEKEFEITTEVATELNDSDVTISQNKWYNNIYIIITLILLIVLIISFIIFVFNKKEVKIHKVKDTEI